MNDVFKTNVAEASEAFKKFLTDTEEPDDAKHEIYIDSYDIKKIVESANSLDSSGIIEMLSLADLVRGWVENTYLPVMKVFSDSSYAKVYKDVIEKINSEIVTKCRSSMIKTLSLAVAMALDKPEIGSGDEVEKVFDSSLYFVVQELTRLKFEVYANSGLPFNKTNNLSKTVHVFNSLAECVSTIERSADGIYVCYISVEGTLDGWFGFFFKSNGNIFSYNDRIDEEYVGQHLRMRNGRYAEGKGYDLFPYDLCNFSEKTDYKGYSTSFSIGENREIVMSGGKLDSFCKTVLSIVLLTNKHDGKTVSGETVIIDSLLTKNIKQLESGEATTALVEVKNSEIALAHSEYKIPEFDLSVLMKGGYDKQFDHSSGGDGYFKGVNQILIDVYGDGFKIDYDRVLSSTSSKRLLGDSECRQEFVGNKKRYDMRSYQEIRQQLANHIRARMEKEFSDFGGVDGLRKWYKETVLSIKGKLLSLCAECFANTKNEESYYFGPQTEIEHFGSGMNRCFVSVADKKYGRYGAINHYDYKKNKFSSLFTDSEANVFFNISFDAYFQVEEFIERDLPNFCKGWFRIMPYNGNCILDTVDPVGELTHPFAREAPNIFNIKVGFGKSEINKEIKRKNGVKSFEARRPDIKMPNMGSYVCNEGDVS